MAKGVWLMVALAIVQATPPAFRSGTELVALNVTVTDDQGHVVSGLMRDAFAVAEEGAPRPIVQFASGSVPISLVIALDASTSMAGARIGYAREAILRFFDRLGANDEFYVFGFNFEVFNVIRGTKTRAEVERALADVHAFGGTALYDAVPAGLRALERAANRRRAVIVITDGNDDVPAQRGAGQKLFAGRRESNAIDAARRSEATVYAIAADPPGAGQRINRGALERLTSPTGGTVRLAATDRGILTAADEIGDELRFQYVLGFTPSHRLDGKFHKVRVTVPGCPTCAARTRAGFIADK